MDQILDAPVRNEKKASYAGFWIRFVAYIVDSMVLWLIQIVLSFMFYGDYSVYGGGLMLSLISLAVGVGYFAGMESSARQATLGKMLFRLKVGDDQGYQITFGNALGRYFGKILSALILFIGFFMAGWDDKKQALHDKLAGTYVYEG
ncbi:MAG: RDD family protein [Bacteroidota bacterium]